MLDPATIRLISQLDTASLASLQSAFGQTIPALGRQSQLASSLEAVRPVGVPGILGEHHYVPMVRFSPLRLSTNRLEIHKLNFH